MDRKRLSGMSSDMSYAAGQLGDLSGDEGSIRIEKLWIKLHRKRLLDWADYLRSLVVAKQKPDKKPGGPKPKKSRKAKNVTETTMPGLVLTVKERPNRFGNKAGRLS